MEQKISTTDELHMTRAIEKAATLADVNEELDRNRVIADQLQKEHVDVRFAKTAAAAFNKRLTVLKLQKTADEHKADPFPLCDPELVYQMMGGEPEQVKTASVDAGEFSISYERPVMRKAASTYRKPLYEETITGAVFMDRLGCLLDKTAAAVNEAVASVDNAKSRTSQLREELGKELAQDKAASFTLRRAYGQQFADVMQTGEKLEKHACILPGGKVYDKFASLVQATADEKLAEDNLDAFSKMASELCMAAKEAQRIADRSDLTKTAADMFSGDGGVYQDYLGRRQGRKLLGLAADTVIGVPAALFDTGVTETMNLVNNLSNPVRTGFGNAYKLYQAGTPDTESASSLLDADFILNDRYRDRMMAISDIMADRSIANYSTREILSAADKAMNLDRSLERPENRESLRPLVAQILTQNGVLSKADTAAVASEAADRAKASADDQLRNAVTTAIESSKRSRPADVELGDVFTPVFSSEPLLANEMVKNWEESRKELSEAHKEYVKEKSVNAKARLDARKQRAKDRKEQQQKAVQMAIRDQLSRHPDAVTGMLSADGELHMLDSKGHMLPAVVGKEDMTNLMYTYMSAIDNMSASGVESLQNRAESKSRELKLDAEKQKHEAERLSDKQKREEKEQKREAERLSDKQKREEKEQKREAERLADKQKREDKEKKLEAERKKKEKDEQANKELRAGTSFAKELNLTYEPTTGVWHNEQGYGVSENELRRIGRNALAAGARGEQNKKKRK